MSFRDLLQKINFTNFTQIINMDSYSLVFSLIFFISFMIFFYQKVGSNQLTEILSDIVSYGYTRYLSKDEITNIKNNLFTNNPETFDEITFYINEIGKLYDIYNYKILQGWYNFLHIFFILLIIIIFFDLRFGIHINGMNINETFIYIIIAVVSVIYIMLRIKDINNINDDFNNLNFKITELKDIINNSNTIRQTHKNKLYEILNIIKNKYDDEFKKEDNEEDNEEDKEESFINYSKSLCYIPPIETDMLKTFTFFSLLFMFIFFIYNSISKIVSPKNHKNLKNNFNSLLSVACILTVIEILYFLVIVMKMIKEKKAEQTSNLINLNIKSFKNLKIDSILNIFNSKQIFQKNIEGNNEEDKQEIESFQPKDDDIDNTIISTNNIINNEDINNEDINNENINNENINIPNKEINKYINKVNDISNTNQNMYKNKILNSVDSLSNLLNKLLKNSSINTEYNLKHENRRVLFIVITLLMSLLMFFYYNNNNKKDIDSISGFQELGKNYVNSIAKNIWITIPIFIISVILYYSFNKYNNIKLKQESRVNMLISN